MAKLLFLISFLGLVIFNSCKIPEDPEFRAENIQIIKKGKYIFEKGIRYFQGGSFSPADTFVMQIDTSFTKNDTTFYKGITYLTSILSKHPNQAVLPLLITKSKSHLLIKTQEFYEDFQFKLEVSTDFNNIYIPLPVKDPITYTHGISEYYFEFNPLVPEYQLNGKEYNEGWRMISNIKIGDDNDFRILERNIKLSQSHFLISLNTIIYGSNYKPITIGTLYELKQIIEE
jgi:hypothetical protein